MARTRTRSGWLWVAAAVSLVVSLTPWADMLLYPFRLFTTWVHECGHALAAVVVGGRSVRSRSSRTPAASRRAWCPSSRLARGIVSSAGYLGAAAIGCLLMAAARVQRWAPAILFGIGACAIATLVIWIRNPFGAVVVLAWGIALIALARTGWRRAIRFVLSLLAVQVALNAVYDIRGLFLMDGRPSDAATMSRLFLLPAWVWATAWMLTSLAMLGATLWLTRERRG